MTLSRNPVWKSGPLICSLENLPALPTPEALHEFLRKHGPSCPVIRVWQCGSHWHAQTSAPDPAGQTSGTTRTQKHATLREEVEKVINTELELS